MKWLVPAIAIAAMAACNPVFAQTTGDILQRLEALEQSNADLKKENAALRERVRRIESARQSATAAPTAQSGSTPAQAAAGYAAGAAVRPVYKAAPMVAPAAFSWTGVYLGGHGGFAWARTTGPDLHIDQQGGFGGVQAGLNYQFWDHWVIGLESDASFGNVRGSTPLVCSGGGGGGCLVGTIAITTDAFGTFRERAGYAWDNVLFYETAGSPGPMSNRISWSRPEIRARSERSMAGG